MFPMDPGTLLTEARRRHGVTQRSLARRCRTSQTYVSRLERGEISPSVTTLEKLLSALGEQLEIRAVPVRGNRTDADAAADRHVSPAERLRRAAALSHALTSLAGASQRTS
jgi:transcriptional regulator with XRE-family HTH domain